MALFLSGVVPLMGFSDYEGDDMPIMHWKPFFNDIENFDRPFKDQGFDLAIDVFEENGNVIAKMHVPGINPDDIDIYIDDHNNLHIAGERSEEAEESDKDYYHKEIRHGSFHRVIGLHCEVDEEAITATVEDGVLTIVMPKVMEEEKQVRKIKVQKK